MQIGIDRDPNSDPILDETLNPTRRVTTEQAEDTKEQKMLRALAVDETSPEDQQIWAARTLDVFGGDYRGTMWSDDRKTPLTPSEYLGKMKTIWTEGNFNAVNTQEYKDWNAIPADDHAARFKYADEKLGFGSRISRGAGNAIEYITQNPWIDDIPEEDATEELVQANTDVRGFVEKYYNRDDSNGESLAETMSNVEVDLLSMSDEDRAKYGDALEKVNAYKSKVRERRVIAEYDAKVMAENAHLLYMGIKDFLTPDADALVKRAFQKSGLNDSSDIEIFKALPMNQKRMLVSVLNAAQTRPEKGFWRDAGKEFVGMLVDIPKAVWEMGVVDTYQRASMGDEAYQKWAETKSLLGRAMEEKRADYGGFENAAIMAVGNLPYILATWGAGAIGRATMSKMVSMGFSRLAAGTANVAIQTAGLTAVAAMEGRGIRDTVAAEGGDVTGLGFALEVWAGGATSAAIEKLQLVPLGESLSPYMKRAAVRNFSKNLMKNFYTIMKDYGKVVTGEDIDEILQRACTETVVALNLEGNIAERVVSAMVEEGWNALGSMAITVGVTSGAGYARARVSPKMSNAELASAYMRAQRIASEHGTPKSHTAKEYARELSPLFTEWVEAGSRNAAVESFVNRGMDQADAEHLESFISSEYATLMMDDTLSQAEKADIIGNVQGTMETIKRVIPNAQIDEQGKTISIPLAEGKTATITVEQRSNIDFDVNAPNAGTSVEEATEGRIPYEVFNKMSEDEKKAVVGEYGLRVAGDFSLTSKNGSSVTGEQLKELSGVITLAGDAHPGTAFHESLHALVKFLDAANLLSDADIQSLKEEFGEARTKDELFNEEAAANAFMDYAAKKGLLEQHKTGTIGKIVDFVLSPFRILSNDIPNLTHGSNPIFDALLNSNYNFATVASTQSVSDPAAIETMNYPRQNKQETEIQSPEGSAPSVSIFAQNSGNEKTDEEKQEDAGVRKLRNGTVLNDGQWRTVTPDGKIEAYGHLAVMDASTPRTSDMEGYDRSLQPRSRDTMSSDLQVIEIGKNPDPNRLMESAESDGGAPILDNRLDVLSGNGRVMGIRMAYALGKANAYEAAVRDMAQRLGIEIPSDIQHPVLVRIADGFSGGKSVQDFTERSNRNKTLQRSQAEMAEADAKTISNPMILRLYQPDASGDLLAVSNLPFMAAFAEQTGDAGLLDSNGSPTAEAAKRVERAILALLIGNGESARDDIRALIENASKYGLRKTIDGVIRSSGDIIRLSDKPGYGIATEVGLALVEMLHMRAYGYSSAKAWFAQGQLWDDETLNSVQLIMQVFDERKASAAWTSEFLEAYLSSARRIDTTTINLFGDSPETIDAKKHELLKTSKINTDRYSGGDERQSQDAQHTQDSSPIGDAARFRLESQRSPSFSGDSLAVASLATQILLGKKVGQKEADKANYVYKSSTPPEDLLAKATDLATKNISKADRVRLNINPKYGFWSIAAKAEMKALGDRLPYLMKGVKSGIEIGAAGERAERRAIVNMMSYAVGATTGDMVTDTGADLVETIINVLPERFSKKDNAEKKSEISSSSSGSPQNSVNILNEGHLIMPEGTSKEDQEKALAEWREKKKSNSAQNNENEYNETPGNEPAENDEGQNGEFVGPPTQDQIAEWEKNREDREGRILALIEEVHAWTLNNETKARQSEGDSIERKQSEDDSDIDEGVGEDDSEQSGTLAIPRELLVKHKIDISNAEEMAHFIRIWVADWLIRKSNGRLNRDNIWKDVEASATYAKTAKTQLWDFARALIAPTDMSLTTIRGLIDDIMIGSKPDTVEIRCEGILECINANAIRQSRGEQIADLRAWLKKNAVSSINMDKMEEDLKRKVTAQLEKDVRYLRKILEYGEKRIATEQKQLEAIVEGQKNVYKELSGSEEAVETDDQFVQAQAKLALLAKYGGLRSELPSTIFAAAQELKAGVLSGRAAIEERNNKRQERMDSMVADLVSAATPKDKNKPRNKPGLLARMGSAMVATIEQRFEELTSNSISQDITIRSKNVVDTLCRIIADGETAYTTKQGEYRRQWQTAVANAIQENSVFAYNRYMKHLDEPIDADVSRRISQQGFAGTMTYGQAIQLYASLKQAWYTTSIVKHNRQNDARLLESVLTPEDMRLINALRSVYDSRRDELSAIAKSVTGWPINRPDPLYMPVQMFIGSRGGFGADGVVRQWNPFASSFTPRVRNTRDFDERVSVQAMFAQRSEDTARAVAWGERGIELRGVVGKKVWQDTIERYYGKAELHALLKQINDSMMGDTHRNDGIMDPLARTLRKVNTYVALSANINSAMKQFASFPMFAVTLDGGYKELISCIKDFDRSAYRDVLASSEYMARYEGGLMPELRDLARDNNSPNIISTIIRICYKKGMSAIQVGDFLPTLIVTPGIYKHLTSRNVANGMTLEDAKKQAMTDTWRMVESSQQSSRSSKMPDFYRNASETTKLFLQFASSPILQISHEIHKFRQWKAGVEGSGAELLRAVITNHILVPSLMTVIQALYDLLRGRKPEDDDWLNDVMLKLIANITCGPISRIFIVGAIADTAYRSIKTGSAPFGRSNLVPAESIFSTIGYSASMIHDLATMDTESLQKHILKALDGLSPIFRQGRETITNWLDLDEN